ncbi:hypothetical protein [Methylobacterium sp. R2-1]|uniref:hypothetical protein n=1 Tax=Methylobacterium sp. R2-1 TaxID=2587064 RepID=UPI00185D991E|nr:hypothetical protein [Methylobacterium sp. R2-1]MBB2960973.1 hypothetical protein [Methylobacterium sp. R2-1]
MIRGICRIPHAVFVDNLRCMQSRFLLSDKGERTARPERAMEAADALDRETVLLAQLLLGEGIHGRDAAVSRIIEDLRRLEEEASFAGASRQTFQKIASARRLLGDKEPMSLKGPLYPAKLR